MINLKIKFISFSFSRYVKKGLHGRGMFDMVLIHARIVGEMILFDKRITKGKKKEKKEDPF